MPQHDVQAVKVMSFPSQASDLMEAGDALSSNMLWLLKNRVPAVSAALMAREDIDLSHTSILECFQAADPTTGKLCAQWLMETYLVGGFRHEDIRAGMLSKVHETLSLFGEHRFLLPKAERHLLRYKSLGSLYAAVRVHVEAKEKATERSAAEDWVGRALHRRERDRALVESMVLYKGKSLTVAVPLTEQAAKWWGKGTRWCTSADKDNAFRTYNDNAPLVIILLRMQDDAQGRMQVRKFQLHVTDDDVQFMDDNDNEVTPEVISQHWDALEPLIMWAIEQNRRALKLVPEEKRTGDVCLKAMRPSITKLISGKPALKYVPERELTYEICLAAVEAYGLNLYGVPQKFRTDDLLLTAVSQHAGALAAIKPNDRTYPLCLAAMTQCGNGFSLVPKSMWTPELLLAAASSSRIAFSAWKSEITITYEMYLASVAYSADSLTLVPLQFWTLPLLMSAVKNDPWVLRHMISLNSDSEHRKVGNDYFHVHEVPDEHLRELYAVAVSIDGRVLMHVERHLRDSALNLSAVAQNGLALRSVLPADMSKEIVLTAMRQNILAAEWVPDEMLACPEIQELLAMDACMKAEAEDEVARNGNPIVTSWDMSVLDDLKEHLSRAELAVSSTMEDEAEDASAPYTI